MSFILDALKKLEKQKETREPGVVMVGPVQWGGSERHRPTRPLVLGGTALAMVLAAVAIWWLFSPPAAPDAGQAASTGAESPPPAQSRDTPAEPAAPPRPEPAASRRHTDLDPTETSPRLAAPPSRGLDLPEQPTVVQDPPVLPEAPPSAEPGSSVPPPAVPEYRLTAISEREGEPIALLNDRLVREGDQFDGLTILRIGTTEIEIEVKGERRTIGF